MRTVIVDLGVGNLGNLARALARLGAPAQISRDPQLVGDAQLIFLPGVGAFGPARGALAGPLEAALRAALARGAWLFGICLGYQLLFESSEESGGVAGLGLLPGRVEALPTTVSLPHIGWNALNVTPSAAGHLMLKGLPPTPHAYFVHSYAPVGVPDELVLATAQHGREFAALAGSGRVFGAQFHPEKSDTVGLTVLAGLLAMVGGEVGVVDVDGGALTAAPRGLRRPELELWPAIDLRHGRVVRLAQGDAARETQYDHDPLAVLAGFAAAGARFCHVVDLDAAFGEPPQRGLIERLLTSAGQLGVAVEVGGGLRSVDDVAWALAAGATRVVVGSLVVRDPEAFAALCREFPGRVVPALETRSGVVQVAGWREASPRSVAEVAAGLRGLGCPAVLVTDVTRDGMLGGPNLSLASEVATAAETPALVSGGVAGLADLYDAGEVDGVVGVIVGRALYEGAIDLSAALAGLAAGAQLPVLSATAPSMAETGSGTSSGLTRRVIPCLDVADGRVVKGVRFVDLTDQGDPAELAARYAQEGADEIVFLDVTAAPERRTTNLDWVERTAREVFVPLTVGGGVASVDDARQLLAAGADKVAVNSAAVARPELIRELATRFGRQCVVLAIDARRLEAGGWEVVTHGGRRAHDLDVLAWIATGIEYGAGEILLTSIDADGTRAGYDLELLRAAVVVANRVPVIASGGVGSRRHLADGLAAGAAAVLAASIFHQGDERVDEVKVWLRDQGFAVRPPRPEPGNEPHLPLAEHREQAPELIEVLQ